MILSSLAHKYKKFEGLHYSSPSSVQICLLNTLPAAQVHSTGRPVIFVSEVFQKVMN